jgi:hypothetical protein
MKKTITLSMICLLFAAAFVSCGKNEKKEWSRFIGYTVNDIAGQYAFSNASDAFSSLMESEEGHLCSDAIVSIYANSAQTISLTVDYPDHNFQKSFSGKPSLSPNPFLISMYGNMVNYRQYGVSAEVMKNEQNDIRLKGFVTEDHYQRIYDEVAQAYDTVYDYSIKYYFDVIKN